ncbi:MAG: heme exporter protein CcmB [Bacteroidetes bacterium]|nr:heme exporter protein CcmB [Bacteroidota bacterium]
MIPNRIFAAVSILKQTIGLLRLEFIQEARQKYAFYGVLLFVVSTVFICKFSFHTVKDVPTWNSLFWIILLFAAVTAAARSFSRESKGRLLYLYTLADPRAVLLGKLVYNILLMCFLGAAALCIFAFLIGFPVQGQPMFLLGLFLGCIALASSFTMISAIASKAGNNFTLMAILGFPVVLPVLLAAIKISKYAADGLSWYGALNYLGVLAAMNIVVAALAYLLFPYLWRD